MTLQKKDLSVMHSAMKELWHFPFPSYKIKQKGVKTSGFYILY